MNLKHIIFTVASILIALQTLAQIESNQDSLVVRSTSFRLASGTGYGTYNTSFFMYHSFRSASQEESQWVGVYGRKLRRLYLFEGESKKYLNRFRNLSILKQVCAATSTAIVSYYAYNAWDNDDFFSNSQVALIAAAVIPSLGVSFTPYFKRSALRKTAVHYNRNRLR